MTLNKSEWRGNQIKGLKKKIMIEQFKNKRVVNNGFCYGF